MVFLCLRLSGIQLHLSPHQLQLLGHLPRLAQIQQGQTLVHAGLTHAACALAAAPERRKAAASGRIPAHRHRPLLLPARAKSTAADAFLPLRLLEQRVLTENGRLGWLDDTRI